MFVCVGTRNDRKISSLATKSTSEKKYKYYRMRQSETDRNKMRGKKSVDSRLDESLRVYINGACI